MIHEPADTDSAAGVRSRAEQPAWRRFLKAPLRVWISRLFPYVFAAGVLSFLARRYSVEAIYAEMARGNSLPLVPIAIATFAFSLLFVAAADSIVLAGLLRPEQVPGYFAVIRGKAATVLLHIVHYALGQGAYATWLARKTGLRLIEVSGLLLYIVLAELCSVCLYAVGVIALGRPAVPPAVPVFAAVTGFGLVALILILPFAKPLLERFPLLHPWTRGSRARGLLHLTVRLLQHTTTTVGTWIAAQAFGLEIPFWVMLSHVPIILIVSSLPVNVAGFGAVQGVWLLLTPWAPAERILAFSVMWQLVSCLALIVRGTPFVRAALADIREG
ncbi:MAG TPA: lysylphosphatidylglycerol synthase domain-containing protein, partial [Polyangiaceae bacterium]|nr:lysylphosphatidylglycerol synthase domain-containing protein [Polyangiaceae bacterium]